VSARVVLELAAWAPGVSARVVSELAAWGSVPAASASPRAASCLEASRRAAHLLAALR